MEWLLNNTDFFRKVFSTNLSNEDEVNCGEIKVLYTEALDRLEGEKQNKYYFGIGGLLIGIYLGYKYYRSRNKKLINK